MIIYSNTEKELFMNDYKPLPDINSLSCTDLIELLENIYQASENAFNYHSELLENELYNDSITVQKKRIIDCLLYSSSGSIARIIGNTKYTEIDKAVQFTIDYINDINNTNKLYELYTDPVHVKNLIYNAYQAGKRTEKA
jgi:hypothetical protein